MHGIIARATDTEVDLDGVAVVTGASSGIGEAISRHLLEAGRTVISLQGRPPRLRHEMYGPR